MSRVLAAQWAVKGKRPDDNEEYRILRCGDWGASRFEALLAADLPGTPQTRDSGEPGSLPWFTVGVHGDTDRWVCAVGTRWSGDRDKYHRAIVESRVLALPHDDLAACGASYRHLFEAVMHTPLPERDGGPVSIVLREPAPADSPIDHWWALGVAVLLLEGRVVVTGIDGTDIWRRVDLLDAVCRYLPYGVRAYLDLSTWLVSTDAHHRLAFAARRGAGVTEVAFAGRPPEPRTDAAANYLSVAVDLIERGRGDVLVAELARTGTPLPFVEAATRAFDLARESDLPYFVAEDLLSQRVVDPDVVRRALLKHEPARLRPEAREAAYRMALSDARPAEVTDLIAHWSPELLAALVTLVNRTDGDGRQRGVLVYAAVAEARERRELDALLVSLMAHGRNPRAGVAPAVLPAVLMVVDEGGVVPKTRRRFAEDPDAAQQLIESAVTGPVLDKLPVWLAGEGPMPPWLGVIVELLGDGDDHMIADRAAHAARVQRPGIATLAFIIAVARRRLGRLRPILWADLLAQVRASDTSRHRTVIARLTDRIDPDDLATPFLRAWTDVLCALVAAPFVLFDRLPDDVDDYVRQVRQAGDAAAELIGPRAAAEAVDEVLLHVSRAVAGRPGEQRRLLSALLRHEPLPRASTLTLVREALDTEPVETLTALEAVAGLDTRVARDAAVAWRLGLARWERRPPVDDSAAELAIPLARIVVGEGGGRPVLRQPRERWTAVVARIPLAADPAGLLALIDRTAEAMVDLGLATPQDAHDWFVDAVARASDGTFGAAPSAPALGAALGAIRDGHAARHAAAQARVTAATDHLAPPQSAPPPPSRQPSSGWQKEKWRNSLGGRRS